jgi:hypothetical protein
LKFAEMELAAFRAATKTAQPAARGPALPASPELRKLREEKLKAARHNLDAANGVLARGILGSLQERYLWSKRVYEAERELDPSPAGRVKAAREHFDRMSAMEKAHANIKMAVSEVERSEIRFYRLEAEIWLKEAEAARPKASAPPAGFRGTVTRGGKGYISFTPGLDAGVRRGMAFRIYRHGQPSVEIGRVVVDVVNPKDAMGRYEQSVPVAARVTGEEEVPKPGDELRPE